MVVVIFVEEDVVLCVDIVEELLALDCLEVLQLVDGVERVDGLEVETVGVVVTFIVPGVVVMP